MKKRFMSLLLVLVMVFSLLPISAMAEVYPVDDSVAKLDIIFQNGDTKISTQSVFKQTGEALPAEAIYDPGCPLEPGTMFVGWQINGGAPMDIKGVLDYVNGHTLTGSLTVNAVTSPVRYLVYNDEEGRVLKTDTVTQKDGSWKAKVDYDYAPAVSTKEHAGWTTKKGSDNVEYNNGDTIPVNESRVNLYPVCKTGYWLSFDNNLGKQAIADDTRATFTAPKLYTEGEKTKEPTPPTRPGYTLEGWYTDEAMNNKYTFGQPLSADTTLYAKWVPSGTVNYQVIFWKQKTTDPVNDDTADNTYDYFAAISEPRTAHAGDVVNPSADDRNRASDMEDNIVKGTTENYNFFVYNAEKTNKNVVVKGDGTTVLNVYYDRKTITYNFNYGSNNGYSQYESASAFINSYPDSNGYYDENGNQLTVTEEGNYNGHKVYYLYRNGREYAIVYYYYGWDYDGDLPYYKNNLPSGTVTYTGLYGAQFNNWPDPGDGQVWNRGGIKYPLPLTVFDPKAADDELTGTSVSWTKTEMNANADLIVYKQRTDGSWGYTEADQIATARISQGTSRNYWIPSETYNGYELNGYRTSATGDWTTSDVNPSMTIYSYGNHLELRYSRNQYNFNYQSNGVTIAPVTGSKVYYEASLADFEKFTPEKGPEGSYFDGWYADPGFTTPFDFNTTMPDHDVMVYAKWTQMRFRVILDPTGGVSSIAPKIHFPPNQQTAFRVNYGEKIEKNAIQAAWRDDDGVKTYQLVGWYSDPNFQHPFNFDYSTWDKIADMTYKDAPASERQGTDTWNDNAKWNDVEDDKGTHPDVVGKVVLYAKWRQRMDPKDFIKIKYNANGGDNAPSDDTSYYSDMSQAIAQPATTKAGENFRAWLILDKNGKAVGEVRPGGTFNVEFDNAIQNSENEHEYDVWLKADYSAPAGAVEIPWFVNYEGATAEIVHAQPYAATNVKPAPERYGYTFKGWARVEKPADGNYVVKENPGDVWLAWDGTKYTVNGKVVTQIYSDAQADKALYAVWEKAPILNYVVDYNAKMKLAENATIDKIGRQVNGDFTGGNDSTAFYQLKQLTSEKKLTDRSVNLAFNGVDSAMITGKFYNPAVRAETGKIAATDSVMRTVNVIPASSVYFDDDLVNTTAVTVGDGSGYNSAVNPTPASAELTKGAYTYKFYGTGIDVYCTTFDDTDTYKVGYAQARIDDGKTPETKVKTIRSQSETERYNVPTFSFKDLAPGVEHTLTLNVYDASHYKLDGIRVYNDAASQELYKDTDEQYAVYVSMRNALINNGEQEDSVKIDDKSGATSGILFVDNRDKMALTKTVTKVVDGQEVICYEEDGKTPKTVQVYADEFEAYKANSPKTEIYLDYPHAAVEANGDTPAQEAKPGQSITFTLTSEAVKGTKLWIALSAPDADAHGGKVTVTVNGQNYDINVKDAMDMYYPLDLKGATGTPNVMIQNTGSTLISVTNLKITGNQELYEASVASSATGMSMENSDAVAESFTDVVDMVFEPVTLMTVKLAANNGIDPDAVADPGTPDQPDDPKPGWNDSAYNPMNILKTLFQSLLNGLGNLFKGLGGW